MAALEQATTIRCYGDDRGCGQKYRCLRKENVNGRSYPSWDTTVTVFVMAVISYYGMFYTGVQDISINIEDSKSYKRDFNDMIDDLVRQDRYLDQ